MLSALPIPSSTGTPAGRPTRARDEARTVLRLRFLAADVGITGANF